MACQCDGIVDGFHMENNGARPRLNVGVDPLLRVLNHEMDIQVLVRHRSYGLQHRSAEGQVGNEVAIHDVDMQPICIGYSLNLAVEASEVSSENGRGNNWCAHNL